MLVKDALISSSPTIICLQDSKLCNTARLKAVTFLPPHFTSYHCVDADGSRGGILIAWNPAYFTCESFIEQRHTLTTVLSTLSDLVFTVTNVYAPADHRESLTFLDDLADLATHALGPWVLAGDFNLTRGTDDKNNAVVHTNLADAFNSAIDSLALIDLPLLNRQFTWSNKRDEPVLARLDRALFNNSMSKLFPNSTLTALVASTSDHTPSLSRSLPPFRNHRRSALKMPGYTTRSFSLP